MEKMSNLPIQDSFKNPSTLIAGNNIYAVSGVEKKIHKYNIKQN